MLTEGAVLSLPALHNQPPYSLIEYLTAALSSVFVLLNPGPEIAVTAQATEKVVQEGFFVCFLTKNNILAMKWEY